MPPREDEAGILNARTDYLPRAAPPDADSNGLEENLKIKQKTCVLDVVKVARENFAPVLDTRSIVAANLRPSCYSRFDEMS